MTVRRLFVTALALLAVLLGAGCGGGASQLGPETDEPLFIEGRQFKRQSRNNEALNAFLKVIEKRGPRESPESHLEAGQLYLEHMKNPVAAIHHLQKYLELQPNSAQAQLVRGLVQRAMRDFAATIPGRLLEDQSARVAFNEDIERLRREIEELRAENATLRGGGATPVYRPPTAGVQLPLGNPPRSNPAPAQPAPAGRGDFLLQPAPVAQAAPPAVTPRGATVAAAPTRPANAAGGRSHTVAQGESLYGIARRYYGTGVNKAQVDRIFDANRDVMRDPTDLKPGMTLRVP